MTKLTCIHAEGNRLESLPKTFGRLVNLRKVYFQDNRLQKLHSSLGKCLKLETINVENNCLSKIGKKVVELQNLKYFLLANNKLTKLPFNPHSTSRGLRRLTLQGNQLDISTLQLDTDVREEQKKQAS